MKRRVSFAAIVAVCLILLVGARGFAQTTGTIRGTVKDPSGAVVPGAKVTVTQEGTAISRGLTTGNDGTYEFTSVAVGRYDLEVQATGFQLFVVRGVTVTIGHVIVVNAALRVGESTQAVTVQASALQVETTSTELGAVMNDVAVSQLPLNTRDTYQLLQLQPGVSSQLGANLFYGSDQAGVVSVNGGRGRANNYMVNGGDSNDLFVNLPAIQPSPDAIQEFRVITNTFDAEYGRNSGAIVNVVTKSGTNKFHGDVYEYFRNKVLNARGFFDVEKPDFKQNQFGGTLGGPLWKDRTFFFGSYEGRRIRQGISSGIVIVPTLAERAGDFSAGDPFVGSIAPDGYFASVLNSRPGCSTAIQGGGGTLPAAGVAYASIFPGNQIPTQCFDPTALDLLNQFVPKSNVPGNPSEFVSVPTQPTRGDQFTVRVDHKISATQQFSAYYYFDDVRFVQPFSNFQAAGANVPGFPALFTTRAQQWNLSHTWTVSPTAVNEFHFVYFREGQMNLNHPVRTNLVQDSCVTVPASHCFSDPTNPRLGITPNLGASREGVPFIAVSGGFAIGNNFEGELPQVGNTFQWADNFSKIVGRHTMKFGGDVRRMRFDQTLYFEVNGGYSYFGGGLNDVGFPNDLFPNYLLGLPDGYIQGSAQGEFVRNTAVSLFAQDSWKIKSNVTLNYGLRWELDTPLYDTRNRLQTFRPGQATSVYPCELSAASQAALGFSSADCNPGGAAEAVFPMGLVVPGDRGIPPGLTQTYYKALAPRIGLAWSPGWRHGFLSKLTGGPGNLSVRMGYGIFYNPIEQLVLEQFSAEPPFGGSSSISEGLFNLPFLLQNGSAAPNPFNGILNPPPGKRVDWSLFRPILLFGEFQPHMRTQYAEQYNLIIERQLARNMIFQIGYVGTQAHRLLGTYDLNHANPQTCLQLNNLYLSGNPAYSGLSCGPFLEDSAYGFVLQPGDSLTLPSGTRVTGTGPNGTPIALVGLRPFSSPFCDPLNGYDPSSGAFINGCPPDGVPVFGSVFAQNTITNSNYNSLQLLLEQRLTKGLQFQAAYTFSKSIDNASTFENLLNPFNYRASRSLSLFNATHRFVLSYYWTFPIPKYAGIMGKLLDGWGSSGIVTFQSGFPIRITSSDDYELQNSFDFEAPGEPNIVAPLQTFDPRTVQTINGTRGNYFFNPNSFAPPLDANGNPLGIIGNSPRAVCCGPGINNFDISFLKTTAVAESMSVEFRADLFNVFNHTQFLNPDGNITNSTFGQVLNARPPRLVQFALKFLF